MKENQNLCSRENLKNTITNTQTKPNQSTNLMDRSNTFKSSVIGMQGDLMSFALKLTTNREEANDLVQDTCFKALDTNRSMSRTPTSEAGC